MDILKPTKFHGYLNKGGSTYPWNMSLQLTDGSEVPYVVKMFSQRAVDQQHAVAKEVYGNVLAKQFFLPVPDAALVDFPQYFIDNSLDEKEQEAYKEKHLGYKFASKLADNMTIVSPVLVKNFLKEYDICNVYAYDALLYNIDRGGHRSKPNLLVDDENFLLIDHEQTFPFADNTSDMYSTILSGLIQGQSNYPFSRHLLFPYLSSMRTNDKKHCFDEFGEYLTKLDTAELESSIKFLDRNQVSTGHVDRILGYLYKIKKNHNKFCDILAGSIA